MRVLREVYAPLTSGSYYRRSDAIPQPDRAVIPPPIIVTSTLNVAAAILTESALSFLGFGVQPPTPSWGGLLEEARSLIQVDPGLTWFPGLAILVTVLCVNFLGDGLRDALDPHQRIVGKE